MQSLRVGLVLALLIGVSDAPAQVAGHPDPLALLASDDATLAANKHLVFDFWRGIVNAGHVELADELLAERYIQHSPVLPTGRAALRAGLLGGPPSRADSGARVAAARRARRRGALCRHGAC